MHDGERYLEPFWSYLFFLGGGFGFPASLRFFFHVPSSLRARGSLPTYGPCLDPALRSAISRSSYPCFLTCLALAHRSHLPVPSRSCGQEQAVFLTYPTVRVCDRRCLRLGLSHNRYSTVAYGGSRRPADRKMTFSRSASAMVLGAWIIFTWPDAP